MSIPVTPSDIDSQIMQSVLGTLQGAAVDGSAVFEAVVRCQDSESFMRIEDGLRTAAGVSMRPSDRRTGGDNSQAFVGRLYLEVAVKVQLPVEPDGNVTAGQDELVRLVDVVRQALLVDRRRSGYANYIAYEGETIQGTSLDQPVRQLGASPNRAFVGVAIPVVCGYSIEET